MANFALGEMEQITTLAALTRDDRLFAMLTRDDDIFVARTRDDSISLSSLVMTNFS